MSYVDKFVLHLSKLSEIYSTFNKIYETSIKKQKYVQRKMLVEVLYMISFDLFMFIGIFTSWTKLPLTHFSRVTLGKNNGSVSFSRTKLNDREVFCLNSNIFYRYYCIEIKDYLKGVVSNFIGWSIQNIDTLILIKLLSVYLFSGDPWLDWSLSFLLKKNAKIYFIKKDNINAVKNSMQTIDFCLW